MTYAKNNKIEAADFNDNIVGSSTTSTSGLLNTIWGPGSGNYGYGQTAIPQVAANSSISFTDWANVTNKTTLIANHQGTAITAVTTPVSGARIDYNSNIVTNIGTITSARLNAAAQGTTSSTGTQVGTIWSSQLTFTHTVTFESADKARYFFNAGGQLALSFSHSSTASAIDVLFNALATACGSIVMSSTSSGTVNIGGVDYNGISKVGGSGTATTLATNSGFYGLAPSTSVLIFKQLASGTPAGYVNSFISVTAALNASSTVITFTTVWDEVPNGLAVWPVSRTTLTVRPPSTTYLTNTWGTVAVAGSVTGL